MILLKYIMVFMLLFSSAVFAADKPNWTIDYKRLNLPQNAKPVEIGKEINHDPKYKVQFTPDNKVLISFWERRPQAELASKDMPEKSGTIFVVLLLSRETGELIRRVEWPVLGETLPGQQIGYGSRIYPLPSGGYVGIINRHLQVLDSSFYVIHDRVLNILGSGMYNIVMPLSGRFFILDVRYSLFKRTSEIIDSITFKIIERFDVPDFGILDIWENHLLALVRSNENSNRIDILKGEIGGTWNVLAQNLSYGRYMGSGKKSFIYNGAIVIEDIIGQMPLTKGIWYMIEDGKRSDQIYKGLLFKPSWNTPIVAVKGVELSDFRRALDLDSKDWIEAYDLSTQQVLFKTRKYSASDIVDYTISPNGDSIVLMTKKKIELFNVPAHGAKKK